MKTSALKTLGGTLLGTWLAVNPANALAEEPKPITNPAGTHVASVIPAAHTPAQDRIATLNAKYSVNARNISDVPNRDARHTAGVISPEAIVVLYQGSNLEWQEAVQAGASKSRDGGEGQAPIYVRGMLIGKSDPNFAEGTDSFVIYVDKFPVTDPIDASVNPEISVQAAIDTANTRFLLPKVSGLHNNNP